MKGTLIALMLAAYAIVFGIGVPISVDGENRYAVVYSDALVQASGEIKNIKEMLRLIRDMYSVNDISLIANVMAGESYQSEWEDMKNVGMSILNRVDDPRFPNTVYGVVTQVNQMNYSNGRYIAQVYYDAAAEVYNTWILNKCGASLPWNSGIFWWCAGGGRTNVFRGQY